MKELDLSQEELARYSRHVVIPEFNIEGQKKLNAARVLVVGAGGLGSPVLLYLAAAGVGTIGILDFDSVEESNLQRQVLYGVKDLGKPKAVAAKERITDLNPNIQVVVHQERLNSKNAQQIFSNYDIVADGADNFPTRYLVNDAAVFAGIPNVYASVFRFEGQVSVFNYNNGPNYRDVYPTPPAPGTVPNCAEAGVLGVLPGIIGSMQANEVIKVITGIGEPLSGRLFRFDALSFTAQVFQVPKDPDNPLTGVHPVLKELIDYDQFCGLSSEHPIKELSVQELQDKINRKENFQLIDVREPYEYDIVNIRGQLIPLNTLLDNLDKIARDIPVVLHCKSGVRSAKAIALLKEMGFDNLYNLRGGIHAYAKEIDPSLPLY